jgi:hypothetical protein
MEVGRNLNKNHREWQIVWEFVAIPTSLGERRKSPEELAMGTKVVGFSGRVLWKTSRQRA